MATANADLAATSGAATSAATPTTATSNSTTTATTSSARPGQPGAADAPTAGQRQRVSVDSLDIDLIEEGLGPMRLRALSRGGSLHVSLAASDPVVRAQLQGHASELRRDMASSGIDLGSLDVDTMDTATDADDSNQRHFDGGTSGNATNDPSRDGRSAPSRTASPISGRITSGISAIAPRSPRTLSGVTSDVTSDSTSSSGIDVRI